ncbi:uncharacterized protein AMSG_11809 [Thecamonas trahens ATCC 50062]|uniref:Uncharacterized protein n=1 Tax=Thecamonas trahens ATCC 50062 TaxID=461836 RepID=A0A0L0D7C8_THETB|nr:hypothetical protein AMSG_11809 [Thecamonas trahens ATCC 50062]KNC48259.1 hypothetical protein AMSG_11809 [Thecamonas trahens ATCC 50062]|eukprot:XP_013758906.1 hypothetical protein AMSG_11809 [Thecamonas trahens ATCC 50062]
MARPGAVDSDDVDVGIWKDVYGAWVASLPPGVPVAYAIAMRKVLARIVACAGAEDTILTGRPWPDLAYLWRNLEVPVPLSLATLYRWVGGQKNLLQVDANDSARRSAVSTALFGGRSVARPYVMALITPDAVDMFEDNVVFAQSFFPQRMYAVDRRSGIPRVHGSWGGSFAYDLAPPRAASADRWSPDEPLLAWLTSFANQLDAGHIAHDSLVSEPEPGVIKPLSHFPAAGPYFGSARAAGIVVELALLCAPATETGWEYLVKIYLDPSDGDAIGTRFALAGVQFLYSDTDAIVEQARLNGLVPTVDPVDGRPSRASSWQTSAILPGDVPLAGSVSLVVQFVSDPGGGEASVTTGAEVITIVVENVSLERPLFLY